MLNTRSLTFTNTFSLLVGIICQQLTGLAFHSVMNINQLVPTTEFICTTKILETQRSINDGDQS